jgi:predicted regulator of amino acid metabolism with ACT domain
VEISVDDADQPGILADVSSIISGAGISIRQAIVEDPELNEDPKLYVVTRSEVPAELIPLLKKAKGVRELTLR